MPKETFEDFIYQNPNCKSLADSVEAREIFDILNDDEHIIAAIDASENNLPALTPSVYDIETWIANKNLAQKCTLFDLDVDWNRQAVGRMQKTILRAFGYEPIAGSNKILPQSSGARFFKTAACYAKTGVATMKVVKRIEEVL